MSMRDGTLTDGCGEMRVALGAYVLGALPAAEAEQVREHLPTCPACQYEYSQMVELTALMQLVSPTEVEEGPPQAPSTLLDRSVAQVTSYHRKVRQRFRLGLVASVAAAAVIGVLAYGIAGQSGGASQQALPPGTQTHEAINPANGTNISVQIEPVNWGSQLKVTLRGVPPLTRCYLWAVGHDGSREIAASWTATYDAAVVVPGGVAMPASQIDHFEVVTFEGKKIASIPG